MSGSSRRFGVREVTQGQFKGRRHVSTKSYRNFFGELHYFHDYLNRRLLPTEPEDVAMQGILANLQNLLEHESEKAIARYVETKGSKKEKDFQKCIEQGDVSFKTKCEWLHARAIISADNFAVMEAVRSLRNSYVHSRPEMKRRRFRYRGHPLLTQKSVRRMFVEVELALRVLRGYAGSAHAWATVPPGYASEMNWPGEYVLALEGARK